jgi:divalent metal cation (Fe/Co/Zn/Cd) transporter
LLFLPAAYVIAAAAWRLWHGTGEEFFWPGFIIALIAIPAMRYLARRKIGIAEKIGSRALRADAVEAVTCGWLSFVVIVTLAEQWLVGPWWIDGIGSLTIVWFLVREGREAWSGGECCCADCVREAWIRGFRPACLWARRCRTTQTLRSRARSRR